MSFRRAQSRTVNQNTYLDNRLTTFTNPHIYDGDLHVERDQTIGGNLTIGKDLRATNFYATGNYHLDTFVLIPAGTIIMSACIAEPGGWLDCDGRLFTVTVYPNLFSAIGYSFGGVDNSFNLPDMRAGVGLGQGAGLTTRALGATGGAETHTLSGAEMPSHRHTGTTDSSGDHTHSSNAIGTTLGLISADGSNTAINVDSSPTEPNLYAGPQALTINNNGAHTHTFTTDLSGGSAAHNNMQPFVVLRYLIKY